jgi:hypothetical protein
MGGEGKGDYLSPSRQAAKGEGSGRRSNDQRFLPSPAPFFLAPLRLGEITGSSPSPTGAAVAGGGRSRRDHLSPSRQAAKGEESRSNDQRFLPSPAPFFLAPLRLGEITGSSPSPAGAAVAGGGRSRRDHLSPSRQAAKGEESRSNDQRFLPSPASLFLAPRRGVAGA